MSFLFGFSPSVSATLVCLPLLFWGDKLFSEMYLAAHLLPLRCPLRLAKICSAKSRYVSKGGWLQERHLIILWSLLVVVTGPSGCRSLVSFMLTFSPQFIPHFRGLILTSFRFCVVPAATIISVTSTLKVRRIHGPKVTKPFTLVAGINGRNHQAGLLVYRHFLS